MTAASQSEALLAVTSHVSRTSDAERVSNVGRVANAVCYSCWKVKLKSRL